MYYEVGCLSEAEFAKLVGLPPADLKLQKKFTLLKSQEEGATLKVWLVSLSDLDVGEVLAMRKLKIYHRVEVLQDCIALSHADNLNEQQGKTWFDFLKKQEMDKDRPTAAKVQGRGQLPTVRELQEEAREILEARREKVRASKARLVC